MLAQKQASFVKDRVLAFDSNPNYLGVVIKQGPILIHKEMLRDVVDNGFWEILYIRKYFLDEIIHSPFIDYTLDNLGDSNDLLKEINETTGKFVTPELARKVSLYYKSKNEKHSLEL